MRLPRSPSFNVIERELARFAQLASCELQRTH
jgi:hypothetical protein